MLKFEHKCECGKNCPKLDQDMLNDLNPSSMFNIQGLLNSPTDGYFLDSFNGSVVFRKCDLYEKYTKKVNFNQLLVKSGFPDDFVDYNIDKEYIGEKSKDNIEKLKKFINYFTTDLSTASVRIRPYVELAKKSMLYFYGSNGTQKTHVAWWVGKEIAKSGFSVRFLTMKQLIEDLINFKPNPNEDDEAILIKEKVDVYNNCDLIIIDESFDKDKLTIFKSNYQIPFLDDFIRTRFQKNKAIIFISNVPVDEIEDNKISHSIGDFVKRNVELSNTLLKFEDNYAENYNKYSGESIVQLF
jgi:hypothetical protein